MSYPETGSTTPVRWLLSQLAYVFAVDGDLTSLSDTRERFNSAANPKMTEASSQLWMAQAELTVGNLDLAEKALELSELAATDRREVATIGWCKLVRANLELQRDELADLAGYVVEVRDICEGSSLMALRKELEQFEQRETRRSV